MNKKSNNQVYLKNSSIIRYIYIFKPKKEISFFFEKEKRKKKVI